ncbi:tim10 ddp zinc finger domain-containing protein [Nannochloropsis gaditana CCMP526]|nr:tim10 ddp zinc finger domain-containing protein [Nannochloropsis gaditana CCMP526]EKU21778.1 tim10 ddp zinc finger domain-containing protein [Nannochloropsis gaditana CCMP526]|eukprot:XP_005854578.1 tim10 ddp zinc finger domain-containing protein [Nannochloropsis gaditana CCMP526]
MNPIQNIPPHQRQEFMRTLEELQVKDSLLMYNRLVERCFKECVTRFRSKKMDDTELSCVSKCAEKYLKLTSRAGFRFAEFQSQQSGSEGGVMPPPGNN